MELPSNPETGGTRRLGDGEEKEKKKKKKNKNKKRRKFGHCKIDHGEKWCGE